ncbi:MAG: hypothetical protein LBG77_06270 [Dysgonamonadaceae bacterium]|jgi:hypothetical protein|nr:hypothetical protein [Dysgonamonadaceae bacterium]
MRYGLLFDLNKGVYIVRGQENRSAQAENYVEIKMKRPMNQQKAHTVIILLLLFLAALIEAAPNGSLPSDNYTLFQYILHVTGKIKN